MRKIIISVLLVVSISSFAQEQNVGREKSNKPKREQLSPEQQCQASLDKMTKELQLNASQQEQIKPVIAEKIAKMEAMRAERMGNDSEKMSKEERNVRQTKRLEDKKALEAKFQAILTPEQFKKMKANEEANKERMKEVRRNWKNKDDMNNRDKRNNIEEN